jgi:hypothetical protein
MKLQHLVETADGGLPLFASTIKKLKIAGAMKYLKKIDSQSFEAGRKAVIAGVPKAYWNYASNAGTLTRIQNDITDLTWAVTALKRVGPEDAIVLSAGQKLIPLVSSIEDIGTYFKGIDAFNMAAQAVADYANTATDTLHKSIARAAMKRLGLAEYYGVKDAT